MINYIHVSNKSQCRQISTYELARKEQFVFTNIAQTNKLWLPLHLMNTEPCAYKHFNKLTLTNVMIYIISSTYEHSTYKHIS